MNHMCVGVHLEFLSTVTACSGPSYVHQLKLTLKVDEVVAARQGESLSLVWRNDLLTHATLIPAVSKPMRSAVCMW